MMTMLLLMLCSLRALYGTDLRQNGIHCSSSCEEAEREIRFFFHDSQFAAHSEHISTTLPGRKICFVPTQLLET